MVLPGIAVVLLMLLDAATPATAQERGFSGEVLCEIPCEIPCEGARETVAENAERLFIPGSVQKLVTATAALHLLGPEYRVVTTLHSIAPKEGVVDGDLILLGAGDPTWNERFFPEAPHGALAELARQAGERGITRVRGDLLLDMHRFPGRGGPLSRPLAEMSYAWAAPVAALAVDENAVAIRIAPGARPGLPGTARWDEPSRWTGWTLEAEILTVGRDRHGNGTVDFLPDWHRRRLLVRGEYPVSEPPYRVFASLPAPALRVGELLREALRARGITVEGEVRLRQARATATPGEIARTVSPPLTEILPLILEDSHNWYSEMLLRLVALETRGDGRLETGLDVLREFLIDDVGVAPDAFVLDDGSGLSPWNLLTPRAVADLLDWAWRQPWRDVFIASLARPGHGTLRGWPALPALRAKTGTLGHNLAIAGYLTADDPTAEPRIFVIFLGHRQDERPVLRAEIAARLLAAAE